eukprot:gnl/MRDRNA2_/MRDRNA2_84004_c0_seq4.p2 gnl/MRDRNA2_/MRDRNA2_84004_c0~~gnl/MRDRNA2_/MRDRNA2_84004_c0_seq4.p2  ORF type:complete len:107 (+),score=16.25 gnl/MRDRNA2_/MRDRNA2_84004_c0_seq4:377-697(+)
MQGQLLLRCGFDVSLFFAGAPNLPDAPVTACDAFHLNVEGEILICIVMALFSRAVMQLDIQDVNSRKCNWMLTCKYYIPLAGAGAERTILVTNSFEFENLASLAWA